MSEAHESREPNPLKEIHHDGGPKQNILEVCESKKSNSYEEKFTIIEAQSKMYL